MNKLLPILLLFKQGHAVADPKVWKNRQITITALGAFLVALFQVLKAFGVEIPVDEEIANTIAAGVLAVFNIVLTLVTTDKIGLPSKPDEVSVQPEDRVEFQSESEPEVSTTSAPNTDEPKPTDFTDYRN